MRHVKHLHLWKSIKETFKAFILPIALQFIWNSIWLHSFNYSLKPATLQISLKWLWVKSEVILWTAKMCRGFTFTNNAFLSNKKINQQNQDTAADMYLHWNVIRLNIKVITCKMRFLFLFFIISLVGRGKKCVKDPWLKSNRRCRSRGCWHTMASPRGDY